MNDKFLIACVAFWLGFFVGKADANTDLPPPEFRNYTGKVEIYRLPQSMVWEWCGVLFQQSGDFQMYMSKPRESVLGCARVEYPGYCRIIMIDTPPMFGEVSLKQIELHERGHCAGWRHED